MTYNVFRVTLNLAQSVFYLASLAISNVARHYM